jgi:hypothetical protein
MTPTDEQIVYTLTVEDIRNVVEQEGLRELNDKEIRGIEDKLGDEIDWYECILSAIHRAVPEISDDRE